MNTLPRISTQGEFICFEVKLQPRASRNEVVGLAGEALKIRLTSPPVEDRANRQLLTFLSEILDAPASRLAILHGEKSRNKRIGVSGKTKAQVEQALHNILYN